jgi:hypothetical protein
MFMQYAQINSHIFRFKVSLTGRFGVRLSIQAFWNHDHMITITIAHSKNIVVYLNNGDK